MISFVSGKLVEKTPAYAVVETNGVGFKLWIPLSSYKALGEVGESVHVLTYLHAREDILKLYGFATAEERDLFQLLISVTGVGPRMAQGILSGISVEEFKQSVRNQDINMLTSAPGVGKKTAERLALELREKIGESKTEGPLIPQPAVSPAGEEAVLALVSLGYKRTRAQELVHGVLHEESSLAVEEIIRRVLRRMSSA